MLAVKRKVVCLLLVFMWSIFQVIPASSKEVDRVSIKELKEIIDSGAEVVIVDNRPKAEFDRQHIKNAVLSPGTRMCLKTPLKNCPGIRIN